MQGNECDKETLDRLLALAKLKISNEEYDRICRDLNTVAGYLRQVGDLELEGAKPLYHVWEEGLRLRGYDEDRRVDVTELAGVEVEDGYVRVPWRGPRR